MPKTPKMFRDQGFIKFLCRRSVGFFSQAFLVFLMKESKKRRQKQPGKLMTKARSKRRSIHAPNLTDELSTAEERRLNQFGSAD